MANLLDVKCDQCGKEYQVPSKLAGLGISCDNCDTLIKIPGKHKRTIFWSYVRVQCPNCARKNEVPRQLTGETMGCKGCAARVSIPENPEPIFLAKKQVLRAVLLLLMALFIIIWIGGLIMITLSRFD